MKVTTIFLLSGILILFYCLTIQGRNSSGKANGKTAMAIRSKHGGSLPAGKKYIICYCDQSKANGLLRKRRHVNKRHKHGPHGTHPGCSMACKRKPPSKRKAITPLT